MRIISGTARGRRLKTLEGMDVRPTTEKVKEAIFSSIQFDLPQATVLDLFAGSGQLGLEALSRGAKRAYLIDHSPRHCLSFGRMLQPLAFGAGRSHSDGSSYIFKEQCPHDAMGFGLFRPAVSARYHSGNAVAVGTPRCTGWKDYL
ncbi:MAG: RsmD family RNA methyltransferase [Ruminococcus sp.]